MDSALLSNIKPLGYKIGIQVLVIDRNNQANKTINAYITYDLDNWPINSPKNFVSQNCLFDATNVAKDSDKSKCVYTDYGIAFDGAGSWIFRYGFARTVIIFGVDNSSSSHTNNFLVLGEGPTDDINGSFGASEQTFSINLSKQS